MLDELNYPVIGLGGVFVAACVLIGAMIGRDDTPARPSSMLTAADLEAGMSEISRAEQADAARSCTDLMILRNKRSVPGFVKPRDEDMPDFCECVVDSAAKQISRFEFMMMEASFRALSADTMSAILNPDARARSAEITRLGREAGKLGLSQAEVTERIEHADRVLNRVTRSCTAELPQPKSPWQRSR